MDSDSLNLQEQLQTKINDIFEVDIGTQMRDADVSEVLMKIAFSWRDYNGGIDDTCHAAKCLHKLVDDVASQRNPNYTPEVLQNYLKRTKQI